MERRKRSAAWYLLPILLGIIGGIIGYFAVRHDDPTLAKRLLYVGIGMLVAGIIISMVAALSGLYDTQDFYTMPSI
ncbi:MAG TPA: hypothetical protein VI698_02015 [Nitrososphaerales archaeon]|nr:hypothetical protein [Nitrososphaerales archaeon]